MYGLDKAGEQVQIAFASAPVIGSPSQEADLRTQIAEERLAEAQKLSEMNETEKASQAVDAYDKMSDRAVEAANKSGKEDVANQVEDNLQRNIQVLQQVQEKVPEEAQAGIQNAIENSQNRAKGIREKVENGEFAPANNTDNGKPEDTPGGE